MATPKDAPYKRQQRNLAARAKATPPSPVAYDGRGQAINGTRRAKNSKDLDSGRPIKAAAKRTFA